MIGGDEVLGVIPARGGSKGVPRKNVRLVAGKPLIAWTIHEAGKSKLIDRLIVTSDDQEIIRVAREHGCETPFIRDAALARDDTPGVEPVLDAIARLPEYEWVVLLQPTSPLRTAADIDGCLRWCTECDASSCVTVSELEHPPHWIYTLGPAGKLHPLLARNRTIQRRQDAPVAYSLNGAVYVARCDWLRRKRTLVSEDTVGYVMPRERSLDVDSDFDLEIAGLLLSKSQDA